MKKGISAIVVLAGLLLVFGSPADAARPVPCPDILLPGGQCATDVGAALVACCPCDNFRNHGQYVKCVAHATNALRSAGCLDKEARRSLKSCAARSTCGKPDGFVTCCRQTLSECVDGFCTDIDPPQGCVSNDECVVAERCSLKRDADHCIARGGIPGVGSCCDVCP